jgi:hypothetical protein
MSVLVHGRPDSGTRNHGWTVATRFPAYVRGGARNARLMHKVVALRMHWYDVADRGENLLRLDSPRTFVAEAVCGMSFFVFRCGKGRMCVVPSAEAVLCGKCHGMPATFGPHSVQGVTPQEARVRLNCAMEGE